jgi:hypothetical protein
MGKLLHKLPAIPNRLPGVPPQGSTPRHPQGDLSHGLMTELEQPRHLPLTLPHGQLGADGFLDRLTAVYICI